MSTTSSTLFDSSSPSSDGSRSSPKASIGLGLGLPTDTLHTKIDLSKPDLDISYSINDAGTSSFTSSPPLLPTRRSPPPRPAQTPGSEFAPMLTPSPSLRGNTAYTTIDLAPLSASSIPTTPLKHAGVGLGLDIPGLDAPELVTTFDDRPTAVTGLGIDLPCLALKELATTIHRVPPTFDVDSLFVEGGDDGLFRAHSSCSSPSDEFIPWDAPIAVSQRAVQRPVVAHHPSTKAKATLGFDSPSFWGTYASVVKGDVSLTPELIYATS